MKYDYSNKDMLLKVFPSLTGCFEEGWYVLKKYFLLLVLASLVVGFIEAPMGFFKINSDQFDSLILNFALHFFGVLGFAYWVLVVAPFEYSLNWIFLTASRNVKPEFEELLTGFKNFVNVILARLLTTVIIALGLLFLIVPGIIFTCKLVFVPYLIMDKRVDPLTAVKLSWYLSRGYFWTIFGMGIVSFFLIILGVLMLLVGLLVAIPWIQASFAALYKAVEELHYKEACELAKEKN